MTTTTDNLAAALRAILSLADERCEAMRDSIVYPSDEDGVEASEGKCDSARAALAAYDAERKAPPGAGFRVLWEIDSEAETPEAAAREAWDAMRRPDSTACVFDVRDESGNVVQIDLAELDGPHAPAADPARLRAILTDLGEIEMQGQCEHAHRGLSNACDVIENLIQAGAA